ncbi:hypothetical protein [Sulfurimonas sp.]|uniref:hypothetical protein n=1 Tax=Sulfurimonas sp. TaxID=2022749 RepID=UPI002610357A|nr:hypothetical protein [Sulfurimonas sp.]
MFQESVYHKEYIELLEPTPKLHSKKCRFVAFFLRLFLEYTTVLITLWVWFFYDFFLAALALVLTFIIMGIVRSKLRNSAIPYTQREYPYTDAAIAQWYTAKELCFGES